MATMKQRKKAARKQSAAATNKYAERGAPTGNQNAVGRGAWSNAIRTRKAMPDSEALCDRGDGLPASGLSDQAPGMLVHASEKSTGMLTVSRSVSSIFPEPCLEAPTSGNWSPLVVSQAGLFCLLIHLTARCVLDCALRTAAQCNALLVKHQPAKCLGIVSLPKLPDPHRKLFFQNGRDIVLYVKSAMREHEIMNFLIWV